MIEVPEALRDLLARERAVLSDLHVTLARFDADASHLEDLRIALRDLDGLFMLVVAGEFNAGKSSILNALLGERVMPEGVTPTTDRITVVTYGERATETEDGPAIVRRTYPAELLRDIALVDTPGTNAIILRHQELTERFIPRSDLLLFVTSADRPFTQSEREFLELIGSWGRKVLMVVNKIDILDDDVQREEVIRYVREHARETLGVTPEVFGVSAKAATAARAKGDEAALQASGLPALESAIRERLGSERLRLKLLSPIGVANHNIERYKSLHTERLKLLTDDSGSLSEIERQTSQFTKDLKREFDSHMVRLKDILRDVETRGDAFFDDTVRLRRIPKLLNTKVIQQEFETKVLSDTEHRIEAALGDLVDWYIQRNLQYWEDVMRFVNDRRAVEEERVIGDIGGRFQYDRQSLVAGLRQRAEAALSDFGDEAASRRLADELQNAVFKTGLLNVTGIGLGAAVLAFISTAALDVTGVMLGLTMVTVGLFVLPRQRAKAKRELRDKMQELRDGLEAGLSSQFETEIARSQAALEGAISPYTRFVRAELDRLA
ncbi:MAG TPA: dynamin family protein, partial [Trueperaceae bacterium]|nr:dynamin family protein [Trueperaceae bacterium]